MKQRILPAVFLTLLLTAPALAADLPARAPGLWQSTTTVTGPDGKPLAQAVGLVTVSCVDPADDQKFFTLGQSACTSLKIAGSGAKYSIDGTCAGQGQAVHIHETLVFGDAKTVQLQAVYNAASGPMTVTSQLQWQGACLPGMQPGDEGKLAGGVFAKTDNINDSSNQ